MFILKKRAQLTIATGLLAIFPMATVLADGYAVIQGFATIHRPQSGGVRGPQTNKYPPNVGGSSVSSNNAGGTAFAGPVGNQGQYPSNTQYPPNVSSGGNFGALGRGQTRPMGMYLNQRPGSGRSYSRYGANTYRQPQSSPRARVQQRAWRGQQQMVSQRPYQPSTTAQQYPVSRSTASPMVGGKVQYNPNPVVVISNPISNSAAIDYAINGKWYLLKPGSRHEIVGSMTRTIEFDRGNSGGLARYNLREGSYKFSRNEQQWSFFRLRQSDLIAQK